MFRKIRIALATFFLLAITMLFLDFTGFIHTFLGWTARMQLIPALLATNIVLFLALLLITLLFGRIYCSVICPLGIFQDVVSRVAGIKNKNRFSYRPSRKVFISLRYSLLVLFALSAFIGWNSIVVLLEPYSAYGRMVTQILGPIYLWGNNILAFFAERADSYAFYSVDLWLKSGLALVVAMLTFAIISIFAWKSGRGYCNLVCPVGAFLGVLAKYSLIKPRINKDVCNKCGLCERNCKAGCIDSKLMVTDYSRCVACFNCMGKCPKEGVALAMLPLVPHNSDKNNGNSRRGFISGTALLVLGLFTSKLAQAFEFDGGLAPLQTKIEPRRSNQIIPPGAENIRNFRKKCTGCQLCISVCPNNVIRPSNKMNGFMQPYLSFERGYCRPECVRCSQVCPTGAITPITTAEKSATQIGYAVWKSELCIVNIDNVNCDLCSHSCPTGAITRVAINPENPRSLNFPVIDQARCIGCGACEQLCPSRPYSAIYVEGIDTHRTI